MKGWSCHLVATSLWTKEFVCCSAGWNELPVCPTDISTSGKTTRWPWNSGWTTTTFNQLWWLLIAHCTLAVWYRKLLYVYPNCCVWKFTSHRLRVTSAQGGAVVRALDCDWRSRVQSQPLHCRVRPWTSCSHTLSSASEVTILWRYINQFKKRFFIFHGIFVVSFPETWCCNFVTVLLTSLAPRILGFENDLVSNVWRSSA